MLPTASAIGLVRAAARDGHALAIHLAETREELELLAHHTGPFRDFSDGTGSLGPGGLAASVEEVMRRFRRLRRASFTSTAIICRRRR